MVIRFRGHPAPRPGANRGTRSVATGPITVVPHPAGRAAQARNSLCTSSGVVAAPCLRISRAR